MDREIRTEWKHEHAAAPLPRMAARRNPGGDCYAYALGVGLNHASPGHGLAMDDVVDLFHAQTLGGRLTIDNTHIGMAKALRCFSEVHGGIEYGVEIVQPDYELEHWSYAFWPPPVNRWIEVARDRIAGGAVLMCSIDFHGRGAVYTDGSGRRVRNDSNHFVAIIGIKAEWVPREYAEGQWSAPLTHSVLVECSVRGRYWIEVRDFMFDHGAAAWYWVRAHG